MGGAGSTYVGEERFIKVFLGGRNLRGKTALERPRGRLENNIKMDLQVMG
jgi:hypothetical protein